MTTKCTIISTLVSNQRGSSLVVVGMFVIALGLLSTAGLQIYNQYGQAHRMNGTQEKLIILRAAMLAYFNQNGRFPCPAPLGAALDDAAFGQESETPCGTAGGSDPGEETGAGGTTTTNDSGGDDPNLEIDVGPVEVNIGGDGITLDGSLDGEIGVDVDIDKDTTNRKHGNHHGWGNSHGNHYGWGWPRGDSPNTDIEEADDNNTDDTAGSGTGVSNGTIVTPGAADKNIRIGNVPTRAMNLPDDMGLDDWGNRIYYVVAQEMALPGATAANPASIGGITVEDPSGNAMSAQAGNIVLLLMSTGGDPRGAMNAEGVVLEPCDTTMPAGKNCDADAIFTTSLNKIHDAGDDTFSHRLIYIGSDFLAGN